MGPGLIYHAGGLGDFVLSLPAIERARQWRAVSEWRYWGPRERLRLLPGFREAPEVLRRAGHSLWGTDPAPEALAWLRAAGCVLAFGGAKPPPWAEGTGGPVAGIAAFPAGSRAWVPDHQASRLTALGFPRPRLRWMPGWRTQVLPGRRGSQIVIHPGSGSRKKNLPSGTWARAAELLGAASGLPVRILRGPAEIERGAGDPGASPGTLRCETLDDLLGALGRTSLFLGNDSGPGHLAAALGVPTVSVFGPSDPAIWRPLGRWVRIVAPRESCAPCSAGMPIPCEEVRCLAGISAEEVARIGLELLRTAGPCSAPAPD